MKSKCPCVLVRWSVTKKCGSNPLKMSISWHIRALGLVVIWTFGSLCTGCSLWLLIQLSCTSKWAFPKWVELIPLWTKSAIEVAEVMWSRVVCQYEVHNIHISDQGWDICNQVSTVLTKLSGFNHWVTSAFRPQTNGLAERLNRHTVNNSKKILCHKIG